MLTIHHSSKMAKIKEMLDIMMVNNCLDVTEQNSRRLGNLENKFEDLSLQIEDVHATLKNNHG